ncbi:unnamed protein product [Rotaria sp. Silwood1]|nr:unnamed protein product [Rotaria sp. Silwood1]CAF3360800.1 unnamed protein product [Rotaria sp. Silwood1]CAF3367766.1 unnamed protein product [Rotaria sp. Silwood1]CAF3398613.1 unnamed protein product [Rotaria sp. Silwood1]CAF4553687.1 unnamed protein product [Rotaria sp. Silwood1]
MISKAVDLVARKLAGLDTETIARLTQVLSDEAQMISEELQHSGEKVDSEILAAKLEGLVARMKYEMRNQGPDPSPHEFPIFNVSHNPSAPYPKPINHLYDKRYKEAYSTFIKQSQSTPPTSRRAEPSTSTAPTAPFPSKPTTNPQPPSYGNYPQGQYQQQLSKETEQSANVIPNSRQPPPGGWSYMNPYATMPRSHAAHYQQQASKLTQPTNEHSPNNTTPRIRRSSTGEDIHSHGLSRSASSDVLNYSTDSGAEKIRVRVINDNSASSYTDPYINKAPNNRFNTQRSILKSNGDDDDDNNNNKQMVTTRKIYTTPGTEIGTETLQDLFKVVDKQQSSSTQSTSLPMKERIIIIDRRGRNTPDDNLNSPGQDRVRTFEIRTSTAEVPASTPSPAPAITTSTPVPTSTISSNGYALQQPTYYTGQQLFYPQPNMYMSAPTLAYPAGTRYVPGVNTYYPFTYFRY